MIVFSGIIISVIWVITGYTQASHTYAWQFVSLMGLLCLILIFTFLIIRRDSGTGLRWIIGFAILFRLILLPSDLIFEDDIYRYLWDGHVVLHGLNPYIYSPEDISEYTPAESGWLAEVGDRSRDPYHALYLEAVRGGFEFERINYPQVPTIYPPATQAVFACSAFLFPLNPIGLKSILLLFDLGTIAVLILILRKLRIPAPYVILYAWNPLIIKEFANSGHHDSIGIFFLVLMIHALVTRRNLLAAVWFGMAVLVKLLPLIMLPVLYRKFRWKGMAVLCGVIISGYLPWMGGRLDNFQGLLTYLQHWTFNSLPVTIFRALLEIISGNPETALETSRLISGGLIAVLCIGFGLHTLLRPEKPDTLRKMSDLTLLVFLLLPVCDPWYICWVVPLGIVAGRLPVLVLSCTVFLSYLYYDLGTFPMMLLIVEFGLVYLVWFQSLSRSMYSGIRSESLV